MSSFPFLIISWNCNFVTSTFGDEAGSLFTSNSSVKFKNLFDHTNMSYGTTNKFRTGKLDCQTNQYDVTVL